MMIKCVSSLCAKMIDGRLSLLGDRDEAVEIGLECCFVRCRMRLLLAVTTLGAVPESGWYFAMRKSIL